MDIETGDLVPDVDEAGSICVHHWLIDTIATNGFFHGTCKWCNAEKDFPNEQPALRRIAIRRDAAVRPVTPLPNKT
jgi:hypothetical protein